jgi:hypothetical protein
MLRGGTAATPVVHAWQYHLRAYTSRAPGRAEVIRAFEDLMVCHIHPEGAGRCFVVAESRTLRAEDRDALAGLCTMLGRRGEPPSHLYTSRKPAFRLPSEDAFFSDAILPADETGQCGSRSSICLAVLSR